MRNRGWTDSRDGRTDSCLDALARSRGRPPSHAYREQRGRAGAEHALQVGAHRDGVGDAVGSTSGQRSSEVATAAVADQGHAAAYARHSPSILRSTRSSVRSEQPELATKPQKRGDPQPACTYLPGAFAVALYLRLPRVFDPGSLNAQTKRVTATYTRPRSSYRCEPIRRPWVRSKE